MLTTLPYSTALWGFDPGTCSSQIRSLHGGKRVVAGGVEYIESIRFAADAVHLPVEILNRRRVLLVETVTEEAADDRRLSDLGRPEHDHPLAVLRRRRDHLVEQVRHRVRTVFQPRGQSVDGPRRRTTARAHLLDAIAGT